jgi:hypothetical protein
VSRLAAEVRERLPPDWRRWPSQRVVLALSQEGYRLSAA